MASWADSGSAPAQDVPFAFLIKNGWKTLNTGVTTRLDQNLVSLHTTGTLHAIVGGQAGGAMGTAFVQAFTRSVPDPTFAAILPLGGPLERRRASRRLRRWAPGGRNPRLGAPLLLPSLIAGLEPGEHEGLPAHAGEGLFEGRAVVRLPTRSGRPRR